MPIYLFESPDGNVKEVIQGMNDKHEYSENGVEWRRVYTVPAGVVDGKMNPWCPRKFSDKIASIKGTYGDLMDLNKELSEKRAQETGTGTDPLKEKAYESYQKKTKKEHPQKIAERAANLEIEV